MTHNLKCNCTPTVEGHSSSCNLFHPEREETSAAEIGKLLEEIEKDWNEEGKHLVHDRNKVCGTAFGSMGYG